MPPASISSPLNLLIHGAAGRMGRRLIALADQDPAFRLVAALDAPGHNLLGQDVGLLAGIGPRNVPLSADWPAQPPVHVAIDFSSPAGTRAILQHCLTHKTPLVIGTTGLSDADLAAIDQAARTIPILAAPNMSVGVNLLLELVGWVARALGADYDIEITEAHHRHKKDAPSGTALALAQAICRATGADPARSLLFGRHGSDALRIPGTIGIHALRLGDIVGEHTVAYAAPGERIELRHTATTRDVFALGALRAAKWLAAQSPGRYYMKDVLGF